MSIQPSDQYEFATTIVERSDDDILDEIVNDIEERRARSYEGTDPAIPNFDTMYSEIEDAARNAERPEDFLEEVEETRESYPQGLHFFGFEVGKSDFWPSKRGCFERMVFNVFTSAAEYRSSHESEIYTYF